MDSGYIYSNKHVPFIPFPASDGVYIERQVKYIIVQKYASNTKYHLSRVDIVDIVKNGDVRDVDSFETLPRKKTVFADNVSKLSVQLGKSDRSRSTVNQA